MENEGKVEFLPLESAQNTDPGKKRPNNEDWVTGFEPTNPLEIQKSGSLYIVADGVGGASRGERASQYASERVLFDFFQEPNVHPAIRLERAMRDVCKGIYEYAQDSNISRMATTMVAANIRGNVLTVANVGDSRCYLIRSGKVVQITEDHNIAAELVRNGSLSVEEAKHTKSGNTLLRSLGGDPDVDVDIFGEIDLFPGDIVLLCSDGLTRYVESETLLYLCSDGTAEQISKRLIDFANESGGADNVSVYVIKVGSDVVMKDFDEEKTIPAPIALDTNGAKKPIGKKPISDSHKVSLNRGKIINIGLLSLLALVIFFGILYLTRRDKDRIDDSGLVLSTSTIVGFSTTPVGGVTISAPNATPTDQSDLPLVVPTATPLTASLTPTENEPPTSTPTPQETPTSGPIEFCIHKVQDGELISTIYDAFGLNYANIKNFSYFRDCKLDDENKVCSVEKEIEDENSIQSGMFLIIKEVREQEKCESIVGGNNYWIFGRP